MTAVYERLEEIVNDPLFPEVDLALRAGRHIDSEDFDNYEFLTASQALLEPFYRRYGCELVYLQDGYFYLLPSGDRLGRRHLSAGEMLVGQALTLLYLDPSTLQSEGRVPRTQLLELLANLVGEGRLVEALNPRRRKRHEHIEEDAVRRELDGALRKLEKLGFLDLLVDDFLRLRVPLLRFADPVRGLADPREALDRMLRRGAAVEDAHDEPEEESE
jgi:chromosome partition protein MukE